MRLLSTSFLAVLIGTLGLSAAEMAIPDDAKTFKGHSYKVLPLSDEIYSWHDAKKACELMGGHLAVITDEEEQAFIAELLEGDYAFLGATDEKEEDTFVWVDGSAWEYTCWMDGQPNNYGGDENYLATYDGGDWVDVAVEGDDFWMPTHFVCEWPAVVAVEVKVEDADAPALQEEDAGQDEAGEAEAEDAGSSAD